MAEKRKNEIEACAPEDCSSCTSECGSRLDLNGRIVPIPMEDGGTMYCKNVLRFSMDDAEYMAVIPLRTPPVLDIWLFRVSSDKIRLDNIEDEEEYQRAAALFGQRMAEREQR